MDVTIPVIDDGPRLEVNLVEILKVEIFLNPSILLK